MHSDQLAVEVDTVRRLVDGQFPQWRALPVHRVSTAGTVAARDGLGLAQLGYWVCWPLAAPMW